MSKELEFNHKARVGLSEGIEKLAKTVVCTLGPAGRNVIIEQQQGNPISTKDGVTVAKSIELKDPLQNIGAQLVTDISIEAKNINIGLVSNKKLHEIPNSISINSQRICPIRICDS